MTGLLVPRTKQKQIIIVVVSLKAADEAVRALGSSGDGLAVPG